MCIHVCMYFQHIFKIRLYSYNTFRNYYEIKINIVKISIKFHLVSYKQFKFALDRANYKENRIQSQYNRDRMVSFLS